MQQTDDNESRVSIPPLKEIITTSTAASTCNGANDDYFHFDIDSDNGSHICSRRSFVFTEEEGTYLYDLAANSSGKLVPPHHTVRPRRRHSLPYTTGGTTNGQTRQLLQLEKKHVNLKVKNAELLTNFDRVQHALRQTAKENSLLREQVADAVKERDRAMREAQEMADLVKSLKNQMSLMKKDQSRLKRSTKSFW